MHRFRSMNSERLEDLYRSWSLLPTSPFFEILLFQSYLSFYFSGLILSYPASTSFSWMLTRFLFHASLGGLVCRKGGWKFLDRKVLQLARHVAQVRRFMTAPGVGPITALCFKATMDDPTRFKRSRSVGAYVGLIRPA